MTPMQVDIANKSVSLISLQLHLVVTFASLPDASCHTSSHDVIAVLSHMTATFSAWKQMNTCSSLVELTVEKLCK